MLPDLDYISNFIKSDFTNSNSKEAIYRGFKFSYNLSAYDRGQFIIRLEKDNMAINLPFAFSENLTQCTQYVRSLIDFIVSQTENSLDKAIKSVENSNKIKETVKDSIVFNSVDHTEETSKAEDTYNCFSHLAEDYEEEDTHPDIQEANDLKHWFNSTDTTRYLK